MRRSRVSNCNLPYDASGNILNKKKYAYTEDASLSGKTCTPYTYGYATIQYFRSRINFIGNISGEEFLGEQIVKGTRIVNGKEWDGTVDMSSRGFLVPLIPVLEGFGYSFDYKSENDILVTKGECVYQLSLVDLTLIQIENPAYGDKPGVNANFLVPAVGAQKWVIYREKDDIIVDHPTMLAILNSLQETPRIEGSHKERVIIFKWRE